MIARLRGQLVEKLPGEVLVDVGGVGYQAHIPLSTFYKLPAEGEQVDLRVVTNLRENALELFAFGTREERSLFNLLRSISGIGPRLGLAILSGIEPEEFQRVVGEANAGRLTAIPGVGRKTAERIVVELKDKVARSVTAAGGSAVEDAVLALVSLGYKRTEASAAVQATRGEGDGNVATLIKRSLARLA